VCHMRRRIHVSYEEEEEDTCRWTPARVSALPKHHTQVYVLYEEEEEDTCVCLSTIHTHTHTHTHTHADLHYITYNI
jgi:hypothetical protein